SPFPYTTLFRSSPWLHVRLGLHPGAVLSYRPLPNRRLDAESAAPMGPRGRRQGRSRAPISPKHARRLGRTGGGGWIGSPEPSSAHAHPQTRSRRARSRASRTFTHSYRIASSSPVSVIHTIRSNGRWQTPSVS